MSIKSIETQNISKKIPGSLKILTNTPIIPKLVSKNTPEVKKKSLLESSQIPGTEVPLDIDSDAVCFCCLSSNVPVINAMKCGHNNFLKTYYKIKSETYICSKCHYTLKKIEAFRIQVNESWNLLNKFDFFKNRKQLERLRMKVNNLKTTSAIVFTYDGSNIVKTDKNIKLEHRNVETVFVNEFQEDVKQSDIKIERESESDYQTYTETQLYTQKNTEKCKKPAPMTQNNTKTQAKPTPPTQNNTKTQAKPTPQTQNNTKTQAKPAPPAQNNTKTQAKPTPQTQNNTKTQDKLNKSTRSKRKTPYDIYTGKIRILTLTEQELQRERHRLENDEVYLKLQYKCDSCIKGFNHSITLKEHNEKHHPQFSDESFTCRICKCVHTNKRQHSAHVKAHYKRFECVACEKRTGDLPTLGYHYNTAHCNTDRQHSPIPLQYTCLECHYTTDSHRRYRYHKQKHKARTVCDFCSKAFVCQSAYKRHFINSHRSASTSKMYKCDRCPRTYKLKNNLATHSRTAHSEVKVAWYCIACDSRYGCEATYKAHLKTSPHHVDLKFICNDCDKVFKRKFTLRQHIEWEHLKNYKHKCLHCNKIYQTVGGLTSHVRSLHLNIKEAKDKICHYCGKRFSKNQQLTNHIRTHTGERPLHCGRCDSTFAHDGALYKHSQLVHKLYKLNK